MEEKDYRQYFIDIFQKNVSREGSAELLAWLDGETDFFTAPASTKYHLSEEEGLCLHSLHVYKRLKDLYKAEKKENATPGELETITVISLLHDLCKTNFYVKDYRNVKVYDRDALASVSPRELKHDAKGEYAWMTVETWRVEDSFPYGHGEKSVLLIERHMKLTDEERMCIRWHMGFSDDAYKAGSYSVGNAFEMYPLAALLNTADLLATYLDENPDNPLIHGD